MEPRMEPNRLKTLVPSTILPTQVKTNSRTPRQAPALHSQTNSRTPLHTHYT